MKEKTISDGYFKAEELYENIWKISSCMVNSYLVIGDEMAAVIDTGYGVSDLHAFVRQITDKKLIVLLTHGHVDHIQGIRDFDCDIYLNEQDWKVAEAHNSREALDFGFKLMKVAKIIMPWRKQCRKGFQKSKYYQYKLPQMKNIRENQTFDLGGTILTAIGFPGHTPGSMGFLLKDRGILFIGDAMNSNLFLQLPESTKLTTYIASLHKAEKIRFTTFLQGHDVKPCPKECLEDYIELAENLDFYSGKHVKNNSMFSQAEIRHCSNQKKNAAIEIAADKLG